MPEPANKLMLENMSKNLIDQDEYPATRMYLLYHHRRFHSILHRQNSSIPDASPSSPIFGMLLLLNKQSEQPLLALLKLFSLEVLP